jgi:hypothetical protein
MKIYGHDVYYLPRTIGNKDEILYEDALSYFTQAYPLEMYLENTEGFEGEGELLTKFGFEFRSTATFVVARRRWEESVGRNAENLQLPERPAEGDLLFFPKTKTFFQINYVDFLNPFYQLGKIYTYRMSCQVLIVLPMVKHKTILGGNLSWSPVIMFYQIPETRLSYKRAAQQTLTL